MTLDPATRIILSVALLLALNNALVRLPFLQGRRLLFWAVQVLDVFAGTVLLIRGVPGFQQIPAIGWMLGLLLFLHVAQNLRWLAERRRSLAADSEKSERARALRAALSATEPLEPDERSPDQ